MPGYDGTGPLGRGPMTGRGDGYCLFELPEDRHQPRTGYVGLSGRRTTLPPMAAITDVMLSSAHIASIQTALDAMERRLQNLEVAVRRMGDTQRSATFDATMVTSERGAS